jgi:AcrR family transcriptional regulator
MLDAMSSRHVVKHRREVDTVSSDTAARILDSALVLITKRGEAKVTMAHIARAARLSRQAVYLHFADRAALMLAAARHLDERLGLTDEVRRIENAPTGAAMVAAMVSLQARRNPALWPLARAVDAVRRTDAAAEHAWQDRLDNRLHGCQAIVAQLEREGNLREGLDRSFAADLLWSLTSLRAWEDLVLQRGWSTDQYVGHVTELCLEALTASRTVR